MIKEKQSDKLNPDEVALAWNITKKTLYNWMGDEHHDAPKGIKIGRGRVWLRSDVDGYVQSKKAA